MDVLASIEPQLAIPVVGVVVFAILVYIFGFQQTQEPSYQHLAVLQSSGKSIKSTQGKPKSQTANGSANGAKATSAKGKDKALSNGHAHAVQGKDKVTPVSPKPEKGTKDNKENVKPQTPKAKKDKKVGGVENKPTEDLEGGDWIQAVSRKDKKTKPVVSVKAKKEEEVVKSRRIEDVISSMNKNKNKLPKAFEESSENVLKEVDTTQSNVEPASKVEDKKTVTPPSSVETTPKKAKENKKKKPTPVETKVEEEEKVEPAVPEPVVVVAATKTKVKAPVVPETEFAKNAALDELGGGDAWEEAKSRGAKKKRARKD